MIVPRGWVASAVPVPRVRARAWVGSGAKAVSAILRKLGVRTRGEAVATGTRLAVLEVR
jgi:hypothetical protein